MKIDSKKEARERPNNQNEVAFLGRSGGYGGGYSSVRVFDGIVAGNVGYSRDERFARAQ